MKNLFVLLFLAASLVSGAQTSAKRVKEFNLENKLALQGYDPVAYFVQKKALKGKKRNYGNP